MTRRRKQTRQPDPVQDPLIDADRAAEAAAQAYERAADRIEAAFERAARTGQASLARMVDSMLADLARLAAERLIEDPLSRAFERLGRRLGRGD
jgi:hypothetical protein